ncbi:MAG: hypothetical protein ACSHYA_00340 [Opitutaceae bacterium]
MKIRTLPASSKSVLALSLVSALFAHSAFGVSITLDGSLTPDSNLTEGSNPTNNNALYSKAVFSGTSWQADNGFLKMTTTPNAGIWYGALPGYSDPASVFPSDTTTGNYLRATSLLTSGAQSWNMQLTDTHGYTGLFLFNYTELTDPTPEMPGVWISTPDGTVRVTDETFNLNVLHTYEMHISDGGIVYRIDGDEVYRGLAQVGGSSGSYFLGDTSGSTQNGTGSMWIDYMEFDNAAGTIGAIPEPSSCALIAGVLAIAATQSRRRARS